MTYLLMVIASTVNSDTATSAYLASGNILQSVLPWDQERCQKVEAASGKLKQQNSRSEQERFIINTAVAFRTCNRHKCMTFYFLHINSTDVIILNNVRCFFHSDLWWSRLSNFVIALIFNTYQVIFHIFINFIMVKYHYMYIRKET